MQAIQDAIPNNRCWGCGPLNPQGLHIKSYLEGDETVCRFQPPPQFMAGPIDVLYGGTIASVIDCHCVCTAIADAYRAAGRPIGSPPDLWAVTASLKVDYLAPTPLGQPLELRARVVEAKGRRRVVACSLRSGGRECARAEVVAVEVSASWGGAPGRRRPAPRARPTAKRRSPRSSRPPAAQQPRRRSSPSAPPGRE